MSPHCPFLCGVDFSDQSRAALQMALVLASRLGTSVTVATVLHPLLAEAAALQFPQGQFEADARRDLEEFTAATVPPGARWLPSISYQVAVGDAPQTLEELAADPPATIVVGTHGLGRAKRLWFGSTTATLLGLATHPVLVVPEKARESVEIEGSQARLKIERLLCGIDFDAPSTAAARVAFDLSRQLGMPVELIHAVPHLAVPEAWAPLAASTEETSITAARSRMGVVLTELGESAVVTIERGVAAEVLIAHAASGPPAIVILGLGGPAHRPGSTATRVLAESDAPVLAVPAP